MESERIATSRWRGRTSVAVVSAILVLVAAGCSSSKKTATPSSSAPAPQSTAGTSAAAPASSAAAPTSSAAAPASSAAAPASSAAAAGAKIKIALITSATSNPYEVTLQKGGKAEAAKKNVDLTVTASTTSSDEASQVSAIEDAVSAGDQGIVIAPNGEGVNAALTKARTAGLFVVSVDNTTTPPSIVQGTFATNNLAAGKLDGQWMAAKLAGAHANIALLDLFENQVVPVDWQRDQGFLSGMGIPLNNAQKNGDEAATGKYSGGTYTIVCNQPSQGASDGGRTAMENCLSKNPNINVVYAINEPAAEGAYLALKAAGKTKGVYVAAIDGSCAAQPFVASGQISVTALQHPATMAADAIDAIVNFVTTKATITPSSGQDIVDTGATLVTDSPAAGVASVTTQQAASQCWG